MARCIWVSSKRIKGECPTCGYDALMMYVANLVSIEGIQAVKEQTVCGRCRAERRRNDPM